MSLVIISRSRVRSSPWSAWSPLADPGVLFSFDDVARFAGQLDAHDFDDGTTKTEWAYRDMGNGAVAPIERVVVEA